MTMAKRLIVNLIDADGCTYNTEYRKRLLHCIQKYRHIIEENAAKQILSQAQQDLLALFIEKVVKEQEKFTMQEEEYNLLFAEIETQANLSEVGKSISPESKKLKVGRFVFSFVEQLEKIMSQILRKIYLQSNTELLEKIRQQKNDAEVMLMLGSNRQAPSYDDVNRKDRGTTSIYRELMELQIHLSAELDKFTLTDLYEGKSGENFNRILAGEPTKAKNAFDDSKVNIIYAACHRIASKNKAVTEPFEEIVINMWDDHEEILKGLQLFFTNHPELLPKGILLNLNRYDGKLQETKTIVGTGEIDKNYKKNTKLMATMCGYDPKKDNKISIAKKLNVEKFLQERTNITKEKPKPSDVSLFKPTLDKAKMLASAISPPSPTPPQ